jgi:hypothetical protein
MNALPSRAETAPTVPEDQTEVARVTYLYLRWLMVLLPAMLLVVTVFTALQQQKLESSISAYYGGPVRDVFVGVMFGTAACMVAYRGYSLLEDYTLNGAGFYAVFVALVPFNLDKVLTALRENSTPDGVTPADYVWFLRIALTTVLVLFVSMVVLELRNSDRLRGLLTIGGWNRAFVTVTTVLLLSFLVLAMAQLWGPAPDDVTLHGIKLGPFPLSIHHLAAILLMAGLAVAVWSHGWPGRVAKAEGAGKSLTDPEIQTGQTGYKFIFGLMVLGPAVSGLFYGFVSREHTVIFLEWWEIVLFCVFWTLETRRVRKVRSSSAAQVPGRVGSAALTSAARTADIPPGRK